MEGCFPSADGRPHLCSSPGPQRPSRVGTSKGFQGESSSEKLIITTWVCQCPGDCCTQHQHHANWHFSITGWCVKRRHRAWTLQLFQNCAICEIHSSTKSHLITVSEGLWLLAYGGAEEVSDEPSWLGIWIQVLISGLSRPALFLYLKAKTNRPVRFLNQNHSGLSGVDTRREPPMASLLIQFYFWRHVLQGECELSQQAWNSSGHKGWPADSTQIVM